MEAVNVKRPFRTSLYFQVITAIVVGVLVGHFAPQTGEALKPLGDGFIKLIKMVIAPIIFNVDPTPLDLAKLTGRFYAACLFFIFVVLGLIARFHGFSIWKFIKYIEEELLTVRGTSSSESVRPRPPTRR